jgi:hypothetical protein
MHNKEAAGVNNRVTGTRWIRDPLVYHFLSRLRSLLSCSGKHRQIKINDKCIRDLDLMQEVLDKAKNGVDMNLLAFRSPDRIYYLDSCPHGLGGYRDQGHA